MADLISLLTFPKTSNGFTALRSASEVVDDGSAPPPRKTPRLDADSDSASASRFRNKGKNVEQNGPFKMEIRGFAPARIPESVFNAEVTLLNRFIETALGNSDIKYLPASYETIYCACRSLICAAHRGEALYGFTKIQLEKCTSRIARELEQNRDRGVDWIDQFVQACSWFEKQVALLQSLLTYLDQAYVLKTPTLSTTRVLAYSLFKRSILENKVVIDRLRSGVEAWVTKERNSKLPHEKRNVIKSLVHHLVTHHVYSTIFETFFIQQTAAFYTAESHQKVEVDKIDPQLFLHHCDARIKEEEGRAKTVLLEGTVNAVAETARQALLEGRLEWLAKTAVGPLMGKKKVENLTPMYGLFSKVNGLKILCAEFKSYVEVTVRDIVNDKDNDEQMVDKLLEFKVFTDTAITTSFADSLPTPTSHGVDLKGPKQVNQEFAYALIDAFQKGFRARRNKPAELIAKHLDRLMRRGQRSLSDDEFEAKLDDSLALYRFTDDKDVFRTFYHRALAKRLLLERSASDDFERAMLKKLKEKYDPEFDMGDQMFKDLALSRETMREFHSRIADDSSASKLTVMVLQRSAWPFVARQIDTDLPPSMQSDISSFSTFYKIKHQGHKLDWDHALGTATLKANFAAGTKELTVSLYQAAVLLLFNEETELGYREIHEHTRMDDAELRRTLQSLACGNKKVLTKVPPGRDVDDDDVFHFNPNFTDKLRRVHINTIQAKETPEESIRMQTHIEGDRKLYLDAAIVRIMKAKKELHFEQLKVLTIDAVKGHFIPDVPMVKQRIAGLVENEYLSRDPDDMNLYLYVA